MSIARRGPRGLRIGLAALAVSALAAAPTQAQSGARIFDIDWPEGCQPVADADPNTLACYFTTSDGSDRKVALQEVQVPVALLSDEEQAAFRANPQDTMRAILEDFEARAVGLPPGPGQALVNAASHIQEPAQNPEGLDVCLHFDFDFTETSDDGFALRVDNTGLRCLALRAEDGLIISVRLEYLGAHEDLAARRPGFEADAEAVIRSLHRN